MLDLNTHGSDWREHVRARHIFACYATPAWHRSRFCQRQLAYARALGKPIVYCVPPGGAVDAWPGERVYIVHTPEEMATVLQDLQRGDR